VAFWLPRLLAGETDQQFIIDLMSSPEYFRSQLVLGSGVGQNNAFVKQAILDLLERKPDLRRAPGLHQLPEQPAEQPNGPAAGPGSRC